MKWNLIAPFTNVDRLGYDEVFPPEKEISLSKTYPGKNAEATWKEFASTDDYGMIDFNKPFGMEKQVTGYAFTEFNSAENRDAEIRLGCKNAWKIWLIATTSCAPRNSPIASVVRMPRFPAPINHGAPR